MLELYGIWGICDLGLNVGFWFDVLWFNWFAYCARCDCWFYIGF